MRHITWINLVLLLASDLASGQSIDAYNPVPEVPPASVTAQADGKILIVGSFFQVGSATQHGVARLSLDGSVDTTFSNPGANSEVTTLAVQPDGKILIGGGFTTVAGEPRLSMARLNADGTLDTTFGDPGFNSNVWAIAVQPDGRILAAGDFTQIGTHTQNYFARLDANGAFDSSFADPQLCCNVARSVALQADGRILIGGYFSQAGGTTHFYFARYSSDGTFDPSFPDTTEDILPAAIIVAPDGSIYVAEGGNDIVRKLDINGAPAAGFASAQTDSSIDTLALQPNGKILIGGVFESAGGQPRHGLARLNSDGTLDTTFSDMNFNFNAGDPNGYVNGIAEQPDGKCVAIGNFTLANGLARQYMARVTTGDYASSVLVVTPNGASVDVAWYRLGDGAELAQVPLLWHSSDGMNFSVVGPMTRIANGWQASASYDVHGAPFYLKAIGTTSAGSGNGAPGQVASAIYSNDTIFGWGFE
ncbi:MAG TPA: delta-60 repeat domain-containing protein [Rhodanobacteraceae bacterium]|jgi:uncharacterized delta-60 repeat protein|nr:delta-60 repeat domain-containing protein [Rhodanobacteraceae bacterium]